MMMIYAILFSQSFKWGFLYLKGLTVWDFNQALQIRYHFHAMLPIIQITNQ